ncbi:MAG TPA: hypothetical protein VNO32_51105 [Candidatus Acidoferrum sp.]|nr:hypothetical protein [Candidatus Acidoferrum sp.]
MQCNGYLVYRVLNLQRMLYENETDYIDALDHAWARSIALRGFLLEDGVMDSASTETDLLKEGMEWRDPSAPKSKLFEGSANLAPQ